jgi:hypothetical protein
LFAPQNFSECDPILSRVLEKLVSSSQSTSAHRRFPTWIPLLNSLVITALYLSDPVVMRSGGAIVGIPFLYIYIYIYTLIFFSKKW